MVDAGNSRLKWGVWDGEDWVTLGSASYDNLALFTRLLETEMPVWVASVTRPEYESRVRAALEAAALPTRWVKAEKSSGTLMNGYDDPARLGVDRWMAMLAAWGRVRGAALVVSAGTAMTLDALDPDGQFIGGLVLPGWSMMRTSLASGTAAITLAAGQVQGFPTNTPDAVESGVMVALCGAIERQYRALRDKVGAAPACLITGGDAARIVPHLLITSTSVPALVLEGLVCISDREGIR